MGITKMTGGTFFRKDHPRMFLAWIHRQDLGRAKFHANAAAFAPGGVYGDFPAWAFFCRSRCYCGWLWLRRNIWHENPFKKSLADLTSFYYISIFIKDEEYPLSPITNIAPDQILPE